MLTPRILEWIAHGINIASQHCMGGWGPRVWSTFQLATIVINLVVHVLHWQYLFHQPTWILMFEHLIVELMKTHQHVVYNNCCLPERVYQSKRPEE